MSGLEKQFEGQVIAENLDATTPENKRIIKELGFTNHGLVIRSPQGEVLFKQADHSVDMDSVRQAIQNLTGGAGKKDR